MELQYFGANTIRINTKKSSIIIDDNDGSLTKAGDIVLFTGKQSADTKNVAISIDQPGEYEVGNVSIHGVSARSHIDEAGKKSATIYKIVAEDIRVAVVGHIYPELSERQLEDIGVVDTLIVPVGGSGFTLDSIGALKIIKEIEPKLVIPTHYADKSVKYEVPQSSLEDALKGMSMEPKEEVEKLKLKHGEIGESLHLIVLKNTK